MLAAIAGDVIGSIFEMSTWRGDSFETATCVDLEQSVKPDNIVGARAADFPLFRRGVFASDDSVLSIAVMEWLLTGLEPEASFKKWFARYPTVGFGSNFKAWAMSDRQYHPGSLGNGAAMRVSPVAWAFDSEVEVERAARIQGEVTHTGEAVDAAVAVALGVYWARMKWTRADIVRNIADRFGYDLDRSLDSLPPSYTFSPLSADTVPSVFRASLEPTRYEDAIRRVISIGGDVDTMASMVGAIAGTYWGVPSLIRQQTLEILSDRMKQTLFQFEAKFPGAVVTIA